MSPRLVLASTSPYRRALLSRLNIPYSVADPEVDETPREQETPQRLAARLALNKARAVSATYPRHLVIGSDQVASRAGIILGKPGNFQQAFRQLQLQAGQIVEFYTAIAVLDTATSSFHCATDTTKVVFRSLTDSEITHYLEQEKPYDCAGSFKVEGLGITLFERVETLDPTALQGLPLISLCNLLHKFNVKIL